MPEIEGMSTGIMVGLPPPRKHSLIAFYNDDGSKAGELWYDEDKGVCFDGDMDESATFLCEQLKPHIDEYIKPKIELTGGLTDAASGTKSLIARAKDAIIKAFRGH